MHIELQRVNDKVHFEATNSAGNTLNIDGSPAIGGEDRGFRPMETLLASLAGCSVMDMVSIIEKQRMTLTDLKIEVDGTRSDAVPAVFTDIHLKYILTGDLDADKTGRAVKMAVEKYCSVAEMLKQTVNITYEYEILPA